MTKDTFSDYEPALFDLSYPTSDEDISLALISDHHLSLRGHGTWKVYHRFERRLQTALQISNKIPVDHTLFLGDLTRNG